MSYESDNLEVPEHLSNLMFKPKSFSKAILSRDEIRFNSNNISYNNSAKNLTIRMSSAGYVDVSTAYIYVDLKTKYSNCQLLEGGGLLSLFGQCTLSIDGKIIERVEDVSELVPLYEHSVSQEYLQTEGKLAGAYRYCKSSSYQTYIQNSDSTTIANDNDISITVASDTGGSQVKMQRANGTETSAIVGENTANTLYVGETMRHNSMSTVCKGNGNAAYWAKLPEGTNKADDTSRTLCLSLGFLFGLFRLSDKYFPLRNAPITIDIQLKNYAESFIHVPPCIQSTVRDRPIPVTVDSDGTGTQGLPNTGTEISKIIADLDNSNFSEYNLTNCYVLCDVLTPNENVVSRIDSMAAGNDGISFVLDTYTVQKQPIPYSENINLVSTRSFSHLKDVYTTLKPAEIENNLFMIKSDRYYGSVIESVSTQVGSKVMPSSNAANSINEMFINLRKCLNIHNRPDNSRGVVSLNSYQGKPDSVVAGIGKLPMTHGQIPDLKAARATTSSSSTEKDLKYMNAHRLPAQAHSSFIIGCNTQRILGNNSMSGLNSIGTSYTLTTKIKLKRFNPDAITNLNSSANSSSIDACFGDVDLMATSIMHSDILVKIGNGLVSVLE